MQPLCHRAAAEALAKTDGPAQQNGIVVRFGGSFARPAISFAGCARLADDLQGAGNAAE
jgi:hypothetical protein